jgi:hypothetical protein
VSEPTEVQPVLVLAGAFLSCALLMLSARLVPESVGQLLWDLGGIGLIISITAILTVGIVAGGTALSQLMRWWV